LVINIVRKRVFPPAPGSSLGFCVVSRGAPGAGHLETMQNPRELPRGRVTIFLQVRDSQLQLLVMTAAQCDEPTIVTAIHYLLPVHYFNHLD
jgi:hypothetical protein